ncbi:MAG: hypothetical protein P1V35_08470 [Planctomycetota bacterium]|nr:hypothetical protein [Planctomycetota bacterium]
MKSIEEEWMVQFGHVAPLGYVCRVEFLDRWLRIHSLPESKRYPDNEGEMGELLLRHNEVATHVLGLHGECIMVTGRGVLSPGVIESAPWPDHSQSMERMPGLGYQADEDCLIEFHGKRFIWEPGKFDSLIRDVAEESDGNILFFSPSMGTIYCPYDGGADLILAHPELVPPLKERWASWLSALESGL